MRPCVVLYHHQPRHLQSPSCSWPQALVALLLLWACQQLLSPGHTPDSHRSLLKCHLIAEAFWTILKRWQHPPYPSPPTFPTPSEFTYNKTNIYNYKILNIYTHMCIYIYVCVYGLWFFTVPWLRCRWYKGRNLMHILLCPWQPIPCWVHGSFSVDIEQNK